MTAEARQQKRTTLTFVALNFLLSALLTTIPLAAATANHPGDMRVPLSGAIKIINSKNNPATLSLQINKAPVEISSDGSFKTHITENDVYQLQIEGAGIFTTVQTFAHSELEQKNTPELRVPMIEIVAKKPGLVEFIFGGDVMMGRRFLKPKWDEPAVIRPATRGEDMKNIVRHMAPYFCSSDFAAVNLESILAANEPPEAAAKKYVFYTHPNIIEALKTLCINYVALGNNHTYDYLDQGLHLTLDALRSGGMGHSGADLNEKSALAPYHATINNRQFSMLSYVGWAGRSNPGQIAEHNKAGAAWGSTENIIKSVKKEESQNRVSIVQFHGSREYSDEPSRSTRKRLKEAVKAGADLVIGHHPHVPHGLEIYRGKLIAWSLGNFIFDQYIYKTHGSMVLKVWMDGDRFYRAEVIPIHIKAYRPIPAMADVRRYVLQRIMHTSAKRGAHMHLSGGHAVLTAENRPQTKILNATHYQTGEGLISKLPFTLHTSQNQRLNIPDKTKTGRDIFFRGDFETYQLFGTRERSWTIRNASTRLVRTSRSGRFALQLSLPTGKQAGQLELKTFFKVLKQQNYSFMFWAKPKTPVRITAFIQNQPGKMALHKALAEEKLTKIGSQIVRGDEWTAVNFNFKAKFRKKGKPLPLRPILKFEPLIADKTIQTILIDDLAVIGWLSDQGDF